MLTRPVLILVPLFCICAGLLWTISVFYISNGFWLKHEKDNGVPYCQDEINLSLLILMVLLFIWRNDVFYPLIIGLDG